MTIPTANPLNRRQALSLIGASAGSAAAASAAVGLILPAEMARAQAAGSGGGLIVPSSSVCLLTPEVTEGPYYTDPKLIRADVTEGRPGVPTELQLQVVDAM